MNMILAVVGGLLGLMVTGVAVYTLYMVRLLWKQQEASPRAVSQWDIAANYLSRWTALDYAAIGLFVIGLLLLLADLTAVLRDRAAFPDYHLAYLLCGIVISAMGMLLLAVRLLVVIGMARAGALQRALAPNQHDQPGKTD